MLILVSYINKLYYKTFSVIMLSFSHSGCRTYSKNFDFITVGNTKWNKNLNNLSLIHTDMMYVIMTEL